MYEVHTSRGQRPLVSWPLRNVSISWSRNICPWRVSNTHIQTITTPGLCVRVLVPTWCSAFNLQLFLAPTINHQWTASHDGAAAVLQRRVEVLHLPPAADKIVSIDFYLHSFPKEAKGRFPRFHDYKLICVCSRGPVQIRLSLLRAIPETTFSGPHKWNTGIKVHEIMILPRVRYGTVTRSSTRRTREEHRLEGVWEQGPDRDEVTGGWEELHNEELRNLCSSLTQYQDGQIKED
jgi:hypothetical protein